MIVLSLVFKNPIKTNISPVDRNDKIALLGLLQEAPLRDIKVF